MAWRSRDDVLAALSNGQTVSYGCGCVGVPTRTFGPNDGALVPSQAQMTADEQACNSASGSIAVQLANLQQQVNSMYSNATVAPSAAKPINAAYTIQPSDGPLMVNTSSGTFAVTVPTGLLARTYPVEWAYGTVAPTFNVASGVTVAPNQVLAFGKLGDSIPLVSDGANTLLGT